MGKLTEKSYTGEIRSPEEMLAVWQQVEHDIAEVGQSYESGGGVRYTFADLDIVQKRVAYWEKKVLAKRGYKGRNIADIQMGETENRNTL